MILATVAVVLLLMAGCGGGGGDGVSSTSSSSSSSSGTGPLSTFTVAGTASKGLIANGAVSIYAIDQNGFKVEPALATGTTNNLGRFSIDIGHVGPLLVEVKGGTYKDEATGDSSSNGILRAVLSDASGNIDIAVTPLTEIAVLMAGSGGFTPAKISAANALLSQLICGDTTQCDILATLPANPDDSVQFAAANANQQAYALLLAAISQMADGGDVMAIVKAIEDDLSDRKLDDTGASLRAALDIFLADTVHNNTGTGDAGDLDSHLASLSVDGLEPTGTLPEAKNLLGNLLNDPTEANFDGFSTYISTFVPESQEAHLFTAMAELMNIYTSTAAQFITDSNGDLDLNLDTDFDPTVFQMEPYLASLLRITTYSDDVVELLTELEARFAHVYDELLQAQGVNTFISLTGMDTVYLDDIDVQVLKTVAGVGRAVCIYLRSLNYTATNWTVPAAEGQEGPQDVIEDLIEGQIGLTDDQAIPFLQNNPDVLAINDISALVQFRAAIEGAQSDFQVAVDALDAMGESGRRLRYRNAFNLDSEYDMRMLKVVCDEAVPSMIAAMDDADASFVVLNSDETGVSIIRDADGFSYEQRIHDIELMNMNPNSGYATIHDLASGSTSPREVILAELLSAEDYEPYSEGASTPYLQDVVDTEWDDPIESFDIPAAMITIDGSDADWAAVPVFRSEDGYIVKLAQGTGNDYYLYLAGGEAGLVGDPAIEDFYYYVGVSWDNHQAPYGYFGARASVYRSYNDLGAYVSVDGGEYASAETERRVPLQDRSNIWDVREGTPFVKGIEIRFTQLNRLTPANIRNTFYFDYRRNDQLGFIVDDELKLYQ